MLLEYHKKRVRRIAPKCSFRPNEFTLPITHHSSVARPYPNNPITESRRTSIPKKAEVAGPAEQGPPRPTFGIALLRRISFPTPANGFSECIFGWIFHWFRIFGVTARDSFISSPCFCAKGAEFQSEP